MTTSRRTILKHGLVGTGLLVIGGVGLGLRGTHYRQARRPLNILTQRQFSTLAAVADRISPGDEDLPSAWDMEVAEKIDLLMASKAPADAEEFAMVLDLLENALVGAVLDFRITTFTGSSRAVQDAVLHGMRTSSISARRTMFIALRGLCTAAYWGDPRTHAVTGYEGPPNFGNVGVPAPIMATPAIAATPAIVATPATPANEPLAEPVP